MSKDEVSKKCFVAMFDILGFKKLRKEKGTDGLYHLYKESISPIIQYAAAGQHESGTPIHSAISCDYLAVSDSVIFYTFDDTFNSFCYIVHSSHELLKLGFNGSKAVFRGAIGYGDLIVDSAGIYIGSAIENAYAGEQQQVWSGCMLTEECSDFAKTYLEDYYQFHLNLADVSANNITTEAAEKNGRRLVKYSSVPLYKNPKDGPAKYFTREAFVLDWTLGVYENAALKSFNTTGENHAKQIHYNTIVFEQWARKNNR